MSKPRTTRRRSQRQHAQPHRLLTAEWLEPRRLLTSQLLAELNTLGLGVEIHAPIVEMDGSAYFPGRVDSGNFKLWRTDGTPAGTYLLKDVTVAASTDNASQPGDLANVNGVLFFRGDDGVSGQELWTTDGTEAGTFSVKDIRTGAAGSTPRNFANLNGALYFRADDGVHGHELWKSDGTAAGTALVKDIEEGPNGDFQSAPLTNVGGTLYFNASDSIHSFRLWKSDGTAAGTQLVSEKVLSPISITDVNGMVFFRGSDSVHGEELWKSDGTDTGTVLVKDIQSGSESSFPTSLTVVKDTLFFSANDGIHGFELWKSDGSPEGTVLVKEIRPGGDFSAPSWLTEVNGTLFFTAGLYVGGNPQLSDELWRSDGTLAGTVLVKDAAALGSYARDLTNVNGTLFFQSLGGGSGFQIWKSDGTTGGTTRITDKPAGETHIRYLTNVNGVLLFQADDGTGDALWKSDGTAGGTTIVRSEGAAPCSTVVLTAADSGAGSLRAAITCANDTPGTDEVRFNIPGSGVQTISLQSALPTITEPIIIDGYTQPGARANTLPNGNNANQLIELNGRSASGFANGLTLTSSDSTIRGLIITEFGNDAVVLQGSSARANTIEGNILARNSRGIFVDGAPLNTVGGSLPGARNVISDNQLGIIVTGSEASGNVVAGNFIGTDNTGTSSLGNIFGGISIGSNAPRNVIGGETAGARNVISGNFGPGVRVVSAVANTVQGNFIGTDVTGAVAVGNRTGVSIEDIPLGAAGPGRVIDNLISGNQGNGLLIGIGSTNYVIEGNLVGTDISGRLPLGNTEDGIVVDGTSVTVGGSEPGARNVISANQNSGITIRGSGGLVQGNLIGTDITGSHLLGNRLVGVVVGGPNISIGGRVPAQRNVVSANGSHGVLIESFRVVAGSQIVGNFIGTDIMGVSALGNVRSGIYIGTSHIAIGGTSPGAGNVIAFNGAAGVEVSESFDVAKSNAILANSIFSNGGLGIDLRAADGAAQNDADDADSGPNRLQNFPELSLVSLTGMTVGLQYVVPSATANSAYPLRVEFFKADVDSQEGHTLVGFDNYTAADAGRLKSFAFTPAVAVSLGDRIVSTATDSNSNTSEFSPSISLSFSNISPSVMLGGDAILTEGSLFAAIGTFTDPDVGDSWTTTVDYGDGTAQQPLDVQANKTFQLGHAYSDNGNFTIAVNVRDSSGLVGSASLRVVVHNVAAQDLTWHGPVRATRGQSLAFSGSFSDPGTQDKQTAAVDWGDRSANSATVMKTGGAWQVNAKHTYASGGIFQALVTVADDDGGTATQAATVLVVGARINGSTLEIVGSAQRDNIKLSLKGNALLVNGTFGNKKIVQAFPSWGVQNIVVDLGDGNDSFTVGAKIKLPLFVNAGAGDDAVQAGGGTALVIGGTGQDQLSGGGKSDLLIAGPTAYDSNHPAMAAIFAEWSSGRPLAVRADNLRKGAGSVLSGLNIALKSKETVLDDASFDRLLGGGDLDWLLFDTKKDKARDKADLTN